MERGEDGVSRVATFGFDQRRPRRARAQRLMMVSARRARRGGGGRERGSSLVSLSAAKDVRFPRCATKRVDEDNRLSVLLEEIHFERE